MHTRGYGKKTEGQNRCQEAARLSFASGARTARCKDGNGSNEQEMGFTVIYSVGSRLWRRPGFPSHCLALVEEHRLISSASS